MSGRPCSACGQRGAVEAHFYHGTQPAAPRVAAPAHIDVPRAWSPWLAPLLGLLGGPAAGGWFAACNLRRLGAPTLSPARLTAALLAMQWLVSGLAASYFRNDPDKFMLMPLTLSVLVGVALVAWQWAPVHAWREQHPGHHAPGADALAVLLQSLVFGLVGGLGLMLVGNWLGHGLFGRVVELASRSLAAK